MKHLQLATLLILSLVIKVASFGQTAIQQAIFNSDNIAPMLVTSLVIYNPGIEFTTQFKVTLFNSTRIKLAEVRSNLVAVKSGLNTFNNASLSLQSGQYSDNKLSEYIRTFHRLPAGSYNYCIEFTSSGMTESVPEFCEEIVSENNFNMSLVDPQDEETIETTTPLLIWTHTDPFLQNNSNQFYRIVLVERMKGQSNESSIISNSIVFSKDNLDSHTIPYPVTAPKLIPGRSYAWQVTEISNGKIINQTEAWSFRISEKNLLPDNKYAILQPTASSTYEVVNGKFYFKFEETYKSSGKIKIDLTGPQHIKTPIVIQSDGAKATEENIKQTGSNSYVLDIEKMHLKEGIYTLEAVNEKNEVYKLSFLVK